MKSCFNRPTPNTPSIIKCFKEILSEMKEEHNLIVSGSLSEEEAVEYVQDLMCKAKPVSHNPDMAFWGLDEPNRMPADARVEFFYQPTYLLTANLIHLSVQYPAIFTDEKAAGCLKKALLASTGREFMGAGYERRKGLLEAMTIFSHAPMGVFLKHHADWCPVFEELWTMNLKQIRRALEDGSAYAMPDEWSGIPRDESAAFRGVVESVEKADLKFTQM